MTRTLYIAALAILALTGSPSHAQEDRAAQLEQRLAEAKERLQLTDDQTKRLAPVLEETIDAQRKILSRYGIDADALGAPHERLGLKKAQALRRELEAVRATTVASVGDILTEKQVDEFKHMQEERRDELRAHILAGS